MKKWRRDAIAGVVCLVGASILGSLLDGMNPYQRRQPLHVKKERSNSGKESCFTTRFRGSWDISAKSMRFDDEVCDAQMETLVQEPNMPNPTAISMGEQSHTKSNLFDRLAGSCILLFGDSTDRQIVEQWCPRWMEGSVRRKDKTIQLWSPHNLTNSKSIRDHRLAGKVWKNGGLRCSPESKFTFGSLMHYGVAPPPLWKFAHTYQTDLPHHQLSWGNTTEERIHQDIPSFFRNCDDRGHKHQRIIVVQSYLWDLARQWFVHGTERPPTSMIEEWAVNATQLVHELREAAPSGTRIAWRFAGPVIAGKGRDSQAIADMNTAFLKQLGIYDHGASLTDFVADYGAILGSELIKKSGPFPAHPPELPRTAYLNLLLNAVLSTASSPQEQQIAT